MNDKINDRTPEEIYKALRCVITQINDDCEDTCDSCKNCPNDFDGGRRELAVHLADTIVRIQQLERERDAAVEDMTELMHLGKFCRHCKHLTEDGECTFDFAANKCAPWNCWQWRGVQEVQHG